MGSSSQTFLLSPACPVLSFLSGKERTLCPPSHASRGAARPLGYMHLLPLNRKRKPGAVPPVGLHVFPPTKQEASAGCSPPCWVTRIPSHSTGTERRVRPARVQQRAAQMVADEPRRAPAFRPRTVVFSIPSPPPYCNAAAPAGSFLCALFFPGKEKRTRKESREPALETAAALVRQRRLPSPQKIFCGAFFLPFFFFL